MTKKLSVKDSLIIIAIAYYLSGDIKDLYSAYKRNKKFMSKQARQMMQMMVISKNPLAILEAGLSAL